MGIHLPVAPKESLQECHSQILSAGQREMGGFRDIHVLLGRQCS